MTIFVLWFMFTVSPGHVMHVPVDPPATGPYLTQEACEHDLPGVLREARKMFPKDKAVRVYCQLFTPKETPS